MLPVKIREITIDQPWNPKGIKDGVAVVNAYNEAILACFTCKLTAEAWIQGHGNLKLVPNDRQPSFDNPETCAHCLHIDCPRGFQIGHACEKCESCERSGRIAAEVEIQKIKDMACTCHG